MMDLIRDSTFGRVAHRLTAGKLFAFHDVIPTFDDEPKSDTLTTPANDTPDGAATPAEDLEKTSTNGAAAVAAAEKGRDYQLVEWHEGDPHNPRNWSTPKKFFVTFQICLLTTSVYIGSAIYTAGIEDITRVFDVSTTKALLGLTLFVLGYALGPMIWAPLSEVPFFGRGPVYIITLLIFVVFNFAVIYARNFSMLLAFRFLTGFVGSPVLATGGATIADMYTPAKQAYGIGIWGLSAVFGPALGPVLGGYAAQAKGWTWPLWELVWLSGFCWVFLFFFMPETSSANILYRRTVRLRKLTGNQKLRCAPELEAEGTTGKEIALMLLVRPVTLTFFEPICFFLNIYIALIYGLLYLWFESFPIVFIGIYGFNLGEQGLSFLGILVGGFIVIGPFYYYVYKVIEPQFKRDGDLKPEIRLQPAFVGAFFIPICLFWFGWSSRTSIHWIMPIIGTAWFTMGAFLLFMAVLAYLGDAYPKYVASVYAGNDLTRSAFGAAFPLFADAMYHRLGVGWASSLLGFLAIAFIPIPFILYHFGTQIRRRSKMARHDI